MTGLTNVPLTVPRRIGEILREPGLFGAVVGGLLVLGLMRRRAALPIAAGIASIVAFSVLAVAGLPILGRYLLLPAAILAVFAGAGAFGWTQLARDDPWRRRWMALGAARAVRVRGLRAQPGEPDPQPQRLDALQSRSSPISTTSRVAALRCRPVAVPNHRPIPHIALWADLAPGAIISAQLQRPVSGLYVQPANARVERNFTLDPHDPKRLTARVPAGFDAAPRSTANASWRSLYAHCPAARKKVDRAPSVEVDPRGLLESQAPAERPRIAHR